MLLLGRVSLIVAQGLVDASRRAWASSVQTAAMSVAGDTKGPLSSGLLLLYVMYTVREDRIAG
jgi:hypothetical protein